MFKKDPPLWVKALVVIGVIALAFYLAGLAREAESVRAAINSYGYIGIFVIALISGFNIIVPIPAVAFIPVILESGLKFWPALLIISAGVTIADIFAYFIGKWGYSLTGVSSENKTIARLQKMRESHRFGPMIALLFFAAFVPLPNEVMVVPLGFIGYRLIYILPVVFVGNMIFNIIYASGLINIFNVL